MTRRTFLGGLSAAPLLRTPQRVVVVMLDGFGMSYYRQGGMPTLASWARQGIFRAVRSMFPSVTNTNNASICCGAWPAEHGITANSYFDERTGREEFMEDAGMLRRPTLFERARERGVKSALLSAKRKTVSLLPRGTEFAVTAEAPPEDWVRRYGIAPDIYSREINYWVLRAAVDLLKTRRDLGCLYVHTTDYPMHTWAPKAAESKEHLARLDALLAEAAAAAPNAAFFVTADHDMNAKSRCWDLEKACAARGVVLRAGISAERDKYFKHHRGFGGTGWVYLKRAEDADRATKVLRSLDGVSEVLTREEAARRYRTMASRIGELVVLADREAVFGHLESEEREALAPGYRSHGSEFERDVPAVVYNAERPPQHLRYNFDVAAGLYGRF